ncbi:hypothetical protein N7540_009155 [Penicillium herquei]|nr:hypothetical protein N7540_009155 [Penicillium herquei]
MPPRTCPCALPPSLRAQPDAAAPPKAKSKAPEPDVLPEWMIERNRLLEELWQQHLEETKNRPHPDINVTLDIGDGKPYSVPAKAFETTPGSLLRDVPKEYSAEVIVAKVNGQLPDMSLPGGRVVTQADWPALEKRLATVYKSKQQFDRLEVSKDNLKKMFSYSKNKLHYIDKLVTGEKTTVYRNATNGVGLVDLCLGPHISHSGRIKASRILQNSSAYFLGDQTNDSLQRIRGVAFPDKKGLADHMKFLEEAEKRNHLKIGKEQELSFFDDVSPGSPFLLPNGVVIFNAIQKLLREEYRKRGYQEVQTPNMFSVELWKKSGHWAHYKDDMFKLNVEKGEWALKPMNCPSHFTLFGHRDRSYRELPMRIADFGVLHRNEASGASSGLTRVRKFQQDDTHIFCAQDQIAQEIDDLFDFLDRVYGLFGFTFKLKLSTRPEKYMGDLETWNYAEEQLKQCLRKSKGDDWVIDEGDGAFYGPKIDITIADALQREFQCATIQLDYQAPINFNLQYITNEAKREEPKTGEAEKTKADGLPFGRARPVSTMVVAFLKFWISPRQVLIVPVMPAVNDYAEELQKIFRADKLSADIDIGPNTLQKKIRNGQLAQYNFILVVGANEKAERAVNVRNRDDPATQKQGVMIPLDEVRVKFKSLRKERRLQSSL